MDIYVDDVFQETVNDKGSGDQITLYTTKELSPGAHTLMIVNKSDAVNYLDSFDYVPLRTR